MPYFQCSFHTFPEWSFGHFCYLSKGKDFFYVPLEFSKYSLIREKVRIQNNSIKCLYFTRIIELVHRVPENILNLSSHAKISSLFKFLRISFDMIMHGSSFLICYYFRKFSHIQSTKEFYNPETESS